MHVCITLEMTAVFFYKTYMALDQSGGDDLTPFKWQVITQTSVDQDFKCHIASIGHKELSKVVQNTFVFWIFRCTTRCPDRPATCSPCWTPGGVSRHCCHAKSLQSWTGQRYCSLYLDIWRWGRCWLPSVIRIWISNYIHSFPWDVITHPYFNFNGTLLTHCGRGKMDTISQMTFSNAFSLIKMYEFRLRFHWNLFRKYKLTIFLHWFR